MPPGRIRELGNKLYQIEVRSMPMTGADLATCDRHDHRDGHSLTLPCLPQGYFYETMRDTLPIALPKGYWTGSHPPADPANDFGE